MGSRGSTCVSGEQVSAIVTDCSAASLVAFLSVTGCSPGSVLWWGSVSSPCSLMLLSRWNHRLAVVSEMWLISLHRYVIAVVEIPQ